MEKSKVNHKPVTPNHKKIKRDKRLFKRRKYQTIFYSIVICILIIGLGFYIYQAQCDINSLDHAISIQEESIESLDKTYKSLASKVDTIRSSETLFNNARFKLGMVYPEDEQVVYIEVENQTEENDINQNVYLNPVISVLKFFKE